MSSTSKVSSSLITSPKRKSSGNTKKKSTQNELKSLVHDEICSQAWQFPPSDFIRMISPKTPKNPNDPTKNIYLGDYNCETDTKQFAEACRSAETAYLKDYCGPGSAKWVSNKEETEHYIQMERLLNHTVRVCLAARKETNALFHDIRFVHGKERYMKANARESEPLKPDIIMEEMEDWAGSEEGDKEKEDGRFWWCKLELKQRQAMLVCEVKSDWSEMITQLGTYARSQFDACPMRFFVLTIAFHHVSEEARFVLFHRSGVTASHTLNLKEDTGKKDFLRIFMAVMIWKNRIDAGFPDFADNTSINMSLNEENTTWDIIERLHHTSCVRGRATVVCKIRRRRGARSDIPYTPPCATTQKTRKRTRSEADDKRSSIRQKTSDAGSTSRKVNEARKDQEPVKQKRSDAGPTSRKVNEARKDQERGKPIVQGNLCFPVRARDPPEHFLQPEPEPEPESLEPPPDEGVLKASWPIMSKASLEGNVLRPLRNAFGVAKIYCTFKAICATGLVLSTSNFLPKEDVAEQYHFKLYAKKFTPPEPRMLSFIFLLSIGASLFDCDSENDLLTKVAHSMLGWLNIYQSGVLHRDISIGNVLAFKGSEERLPFKLTDEFKASLGKVTTEKLNKVLERCGIDSVKDLIPDSRNWAARLEKLLEEKGIGISCEAFILDVDMAKNWKDMFDNWGKEKETSRYERSGTELFMSENLLQPNVIDYIQNSGDDIDSFFWVTLWARLIKDSVTEPNELNTFWIDLFENGERDKAFTSMKRHDLQLEVLEGWSDVTSKISKAYNHLLRCFASISEKGEWESVEEEASYWKETWHGFALMGVYLVLDIIFKYVG